VNLLEVCYSNKTYDTYQAGLCKLKWLARERRSHLAGHLSGEIAVVLTLGIVELPDCIVEELLTGHIGILGMEGVRGLRLLEVIL